jgi:transposase
VVEIEITDEKVHDSQKAQELVEGAKREAKEKGRKVSKIIGDGAYDAHSFFRYLHDNGICAGILVRKGSKGRGNRLRDEVVRAVRRGKKRWKEEVEYGKRWLMESFFSVFKRWFGEHVVSRRFENIGKEIVFKVVFNGRRGVKVKGGYVKSYKVRLGWVGYGLVFGQSIFNLKNITDPQTRVNIVGLVMQELFIILHLKKVMEMFHPEKIIYLLLWQGK